MLTRRTNLLLTNADYLGLSQLAKKEQVSLGQIIRNAIKFTYRHQLTSNKNKQVLSKIDALAKKVNTKQLDYRSLVTEGQK
ncbi:MAG: hypothetical protein WDZ94_04575 [Patescibacteria group bacterium]